MGTETSNETQLLLLLLYYKIKLTGGIKVMNEILYNFPEIFFLKCIIQII